MLRLGSYRRAQEMRAIIALCAMVVAAVQAEAGSQLWRVEAPSYHRVVRALEDDGDVDVWAGTADHCKVLVEGSASTRVVRALAEADIGHSVEVEDMMALVEQERTHMQERRRKRAAQPMDWTSYHDMDDIEGFIGWLNSTGGDLVQVASPTRSVEGREVLVLRINDPSSQGVKKKKIWIEGGIHAREWISPAVSTFLMYQLVTNPEWRDLLKVTEWYIVPVANPDGYQFSFSSQSARLWRKNRRDNGVSERCKGVDLNRNWDFKWGVGASANPCSETYKGVNAFSEPETFGLQQMMRTIPDIDLFITFHSFGQTVLYPWGWTRNAPSNAMQLKRLAKAFTDTVKQTSLGKVDYDIGGSGPLYGLASGATDDWAYGELGIPFSYTIELPDQGTHGFLLPENRVSSTVIESAAGVHCMVSLLANSGSCARRRTRNPSSIRFRG
ncbi:carboxypeptidase B-like isoform X3 [Panulirus ornatus]|uniref:carboxypeptidase B-like isoform X3 n=1 Tax=Panulirus ornatus TaxID=150431 RepID=UPI003A89155E